jgi:Icc protein
MKNTHNVTRAQQQVQSDDSTDSPVASDGIDRRNFLSCMAWAQEPVCFGPWPEAYQPPDSLPRPPARQTARPHSHIGFNKAANHDVTGTLNLALDKINRLPATPDLLHIGDISHSQKPAEFDTAQQIIKGAKVGETFYVPGGHDTASNAPRKSHHAKEYPRPRRPYPHHLHCCESHPDLDS